MDNLEFHCRRLLFSLHTKRYKLLQEKNIIKNRATSAAQLKSAISKDRLKKAGKVLNLTSRDGCSTRGVNN